MLCPERLTCQDVTNESIVQWSFGWHLVEFWRVISAKMVMRTARQAAHTCPVRVHARALRIDVVPDTYKLAIAVVAAQ